MAKFSVSELFKTDVEEWEDFRDIFIDYKENGNVPSFFGKDTPLRNEGMHHIHLASECATEKRWAKIHDQFYRKIKVGELDNWLIYAYDSLKNEYLLLTIMGPDAHTHPKWQLFLINLNYDIVEPWIQGRVEYD